MDDQHIADEEPDKPRKVKLAPLTEWKLPTPAPPPPPPQVPREPSVAEALDLPWSWVAGGIGFATLLLVGVVALLLPSNDREPDRAAPAFLAAEAPPAATGADQPVMLPGGLTVDRSSTMNHDLANWLSTKPDKPRDFSFDRVAFAPGSAEMGMQHHSALQGFAIVLGSYPLARATITVPGTPALHIARVTALNHYLLRLGMDAKQLDYRAEGGDEAPLKVQVRLGSTTDNGLDS